MVYADNAATTKMSRTAIDAMLPYMETHYGNPSSLYRLGQEAAALPRGTAVIYLGWLCAGGIKGLKGARRRFRTAAVCAVGMAAEVEEAKLRRDNRLEGVPLFYLRGGYAPEKLTGFYRAMMAPMARLVSRAPAETEADRAMRDAFRDGGDWVSPERLAPVLAWLDGD